MASFEGVALELFQLVFGRNPRIASAEQVASALASAAEDAHLAGFGP